MERYFGNKRWLTRFQHGVCLVAQMIMHTRMKFALIQYKQWSCELGLGLGLGSYVLHVCTLTIHSRNMQTPCRKRVDHKR